ncbi:LamG domain-containing protein [Streptomyces sp. NPDC005407]|uniref:LamG domain-containing protein n=1 Tax=Streptomyces sp. NPDC005407 TaxID=3155340 RepID=UPI0033B785F8
MTRRWSLIAVIVGLAVALTFVIVDMRSGTGAARETPEAAGPAGHGGTPGLKGVGWWPAHATSGRVAKDLVGDHHATLRGGASWTTGPKGGALLLDGSSGFADTGAAVLDTTDGDYSVAAWVRLNARGGFRTAVSLDGETASVFYLQYSDSDKRFSFSFVNARAVATTVGEPELGLWYHLVGTYSHSDSMLRIYVDGVLAGSVRARNPERPAGNLVIGRGNFKGRTVDVWAGAITDVHAYDRALSPGDVAVLAVGEPSRD